MDDTLPPHTFPIVARRRLLGWVAATVLLFAPMTFACADVAGQWGVQNTAPIAADSTEWQDVDWTRAGDQPWPGPRQLRAQWQKIYADAYHPERSNWPRGRHAKSETPHITYYIWRAAQPLPDGTKLLLEGDFPHARFFDIQVSGIPGARQSSRGDGAGVHEVPLADIDIAPDPGHVNPFYPGADRNATQRHFHVTYELVGSGDMNALNTFAGRSAVLPPYRAIGNLRRASNKINDGQTDLGPYIWVRVYVPDRGFASDPYGGVEPPVLRIDIPGDGRGPYLAPPTRRTDYNHPTRATQDLPYPLEENSVRANSVPDPYPSDPYRNPYDYDRSIKEAQTLGYLNTWVQEQRGLVGKTGTGYLPDVHLRWDDSQGHPRLDKIHNYNYFELFDQLGGGPAACALAPGFAEPRGYGPRLREPGDPYHPGGDEHTSGQNLYNSYLYSKVNLTPDVFLTIRGRLPRIARTLGGAARMSMGEALRYFGITLSVGEPKNLIPVVDIIDEHIVVDANGNYLIVIGPQASRPAAATVAQGITWRDWDEGEEASLLMRLLNTRALPWPGHPQNLTWAVLGNYSTATACNSAGRDNDNARAVQTLMGPFHPRLRYVTRADLEAALSSGGWKADGWNPRSPYGGSE